MRQLKVTPKESEAGSTFPHTNNSFHTHVSKKSFRLTKQGFRYVLELKILSTNWDGTQTTETEMNSMNVHK